MTEDVLPPADRTDPAPSPWGNRPATNPMPQPRSAGVSRNLWSVLTIPFNALRRILRVAFYVQLLLGLLVYLVLINGFL